MTKFIHRISATALAVLGFVGLGASQAHAAIEYTSQTASTTELFGLVGSDLMDSAGVVIGIVMGIAVFIFVVFWGWRRLKRAMKG